jgi:hypothetical protein
LSTATALIAAAIVGATVVPGSAIAGTISYVFVDNDSKHPVPVRGVVAVAGPVALQNARHFLAVDDCTVPNGQTRCTRERTLGTVTFETLGLTCYAEVGSTVSAELSDAVEDISLPIPLTTQGTIDGRSIRVGVLSDLKFPTAGAYDLTISEDYVASSYNGAHCELAEVVD